MLKLNEQTENLEHASIAISMKEYRRLLKADLEMDRMSNELRAIGTELRKTKADRDEWKEKAYEMKNKFEYIQAMARLISKVQKEEQEDENNDGK